MPQPAHGQCEITKVVPSQQTPSTELFGDTVDVAGDVAIVGGSFANAAYVYRRNGDEWAEEAVLRADTKVQDLFGDAVAIDADLAIVGANGDTDNGLNSGSAYVFRFEREKAAWVQEAKLLASDGEEGDRFGVSVGVSGDVVVVGAHFDEGPNSSIAGAVYVYRDEGAGWVEEAKLTEANGVLLGHCVDIDGEVIIAGAPGGAEAAYVYRYGVSGWEQEAELHAEDGASTDIFGVSVGVSGDAVVAGAPGDNIEDGSAFVFRLTAGAWVQEAYLVGSDILGLPQSHFGTAVSIDGDAVVVGATGEDDNGASSGAAYVFLRERSRWMEVAKLIASDGQAWDRMGRAVAVSGDVAVVGSDGVDGNTGAAYFFAGISGADCNGNGTPDVCDIHEQISEDADGNGVPDECQCPHDVDGDGVVSVTDLVAVILAWGTDPSGPPDFNGDGAVDISDLTEVLLNWGPCAAG